MPNYILTHGGLKLNGAFHAHGSKVELSADEAAKINKRGTHLKLAAVVEAELEAEKKKKAAIAKAEAEERAKLEAELEAEKKKKASGGAS